MKAVLDTRFHDLEQFMQAVHHWDLDFRIMDTGGFQGRLKQLVSENVLVSYARFLRGLDQAGATPPLIPHLCHPRQNLSWPLVARAPGDP